MKKLFTLFLLLYSSFLFANDIRASWGMGNILMGVSWQNTGTQYPIEIDFMNVTFYNPKNGWAFDIYPLSFTTPGVDNSSMLSFVNLTLSYNLLHKFEIIWLAPYVAINCVTPTGSSGFKGDIGINFSLLNPKNRINTKKKFPFTSSFIVTRAGARISDNHFSVFAEVGMDIGVLWNWLVKESFKDSDELEQSNEQAQSDELNQSNELIQTNQLKQLEN